MNEDIYDVYSQEIDSYCLSHDIDDYDLHGENLIGDDKNDDDDPIKYE